jgi:MFS family permease
MRKNMPPRAPTTATRLVLLVAAAVFINYIDRGNLATAAPLMQDELHLSASELGVLFSAFYYSYVLVMAPAGWLAERYGAQRMLAVGVGVWSIATFLTGFATSFTTLLLLRLMLGVGESAAFPCASKLLAHAVEVPRLGVANGVMSFGYLLGPAVGTLAGGLLMTSFGWRPVFIVFGCLSILWLWPWRRVVIGPAAQGQDADEPAPALRQILRQRALWGAALGLFSANYSFYFILAWLPFYLVKARGFSVGGMALIASWAYLLNAVSALFIGWFTDRWIRSGRSTNGIYKGIMVLNHLGAIVCMGGVLLLPITGSIAALFAYEVLAGLASPGLFAIPQIFAGPRAAGRWVGVHNTVGGIAGFVAPAITGVLVDLTGQFSIAFALAAAVSAAGLLAWIVVMPRIAPIRWANVAPSGP